MTCVAVNRLGVKVKWVFKGVDRKNVPPLTRLVSSTALFAFKKIQNKDGDKDIDIYTTKAVVSTDKNAQKSFKSGELSLDKKAGNIVFTTKSSL